MPYVIRVSEFQGKTCLFYVFGVDAQGDVCAILFDSGRNLSYFTRLNAILRYVQSSFMQFLWILEGICVMQHNLCAISTAILWHCM